MFLLFCLGKSLPHAEIAVNSFTNSQSSTKEINHASCDSTVVTGDVPPVGVSKLMCVFHFNLPVVW